METDEINQIKKVIAMQHYRLKQLEEMIVMMTHIVKDLVNKELNEERYQKWF